jgi:hypothetical protein
MQIGLAAACALLSSTAAHADGKVKNPKKFVEVVQGVQYDGEYSPPSGRQPGPDYQKTGRVRFVKPYERDIPVIVPPAPIYVDEAVVEAENARKEVDRQQRNQAQLQNGGNQPQAVNAGITSTPYVPTQPADDAGVLPGALPSAGSATGSTAVATYGTLPTAVTTPQAGTSTTIISTSSR